HRVYPSATCYRWDQRHLAAIGDRRVEVVEEADVLVVGEDVDEAAHLAVVVVETLRQPGVLLAEVLQHVTDSAPFDGDHIAAFGELSEWGRDSYVYSHRALHADWVADPSEASQCRFMGHGGSGHQPRWRWPPSGSTATTGPPTTVLRARATTAAPDGPTRMPCRPSDARTRWRSGAWPPTLSTTTTGAPMRVRGPAARGAAPGCRIPARGDAASCRSRSAPSARSG